MLNALTKRNKQVVVRRPPEDGLTADELRSEISGLVKEKPIALFTPGATMLGGVGDIGQLADRSTRLIPTFLVGVVLPTLVTLLYLVFFATPQFESEQSFSVQQGTRSQKSLSGVMALAAQFSGVATTSQETYMVLEYLRSMNAIDDLGGRQFLEPIYSGKNIDYLSRMEPGLPLEDVHQYWESKVIPELDTRSGIITLKVRAFSPHDAYDIATKLRELSEKLVNDVSLRSRESTLKRVENDLDRSVKLLADSRAKLLTFRNDYNTVDPVQDAEHIGKMLTDLTLKRIEIETEIGAIVKQVSSNSPTLKVKREQAASYQQQIDDLESRMTSMASKDDSVARKLVDYEKLKTDMMYYEKLYTASLSTYEQAREDTIKQQIFIIPIVSPTLAESSDYPSTFQVTMAVFMLSLALWSIGALLIAAIKDHRI